MAFARARAARTLHSSFRRSVPRVAAPGRTQLVQRRWASGGDHGHAESGSDLPWALAGIAITIPSCWYLWPDSSHADAGHHGGHAEEHGEEAGEEAAEEEPKEEEPKDEESGPVEDAKPETEQEQQKEEKQDEERVESEEGKKKGAQKQTSEIKKTDDDKPTKEEAYDDEGAEVKKVQKDRVVRKSLPSSGQPLTTSPHEGENAHEAKGSGGSMGSKQAGLSNTAAKHSIPIGDSPDKSKKPEGGPDTAKASGTVAVKRHD